MSRGPGAWAVCVNLKSLYVIEVLWLKKTSYDLSACYTHVCFQGGSIIRLFHKELEAYLVAEGLFDDEITEDGKCIPYLPNVPTDPFKRRIQLS